MNIDGGFLNIGGFFEYWRGVFGQSHFFKNMGGFLNIEGVFLNIGGFLDNLIFSKIFLIFLSRRLNKAPKWPQECPRWLQSPQMASGAPKVAAKPPNALGAPKVAAKPPNGLRSVQGGCKVPISGAFKGCVPCQCQKGNFRTNSKPAWVQMLANKALLPKWSRFGRSMDHSGSNVPSRAAYSACQY